MEEDYFRSDAREDTVRNETGFRSEIMKGL
jgi:hypothetical protein